MARSKHAQPRKDTGSQQPKTQPKRQMMRQCQIFATIVLIFIISPCIVKITVEAAESSTENVPKDDSAQQPQGAEECMVDMEGQCQNTVVANTENDKKETPIINTILSNPASNDGQIKEKLDEVWYKGTAPEIGAYLKCPWNDEDENGESPLAEMHTEETWKTFNEIYHQVVDRKRSSLPPRFEGTGFQVPFEIKYMPSIGRGVFAKEPIRRGQLIWKSVNTAEFVRAQDYRDFLRKLPQNLACDVLIWAYVRMLSRKQQRTFKVCADLDEGSFVNHSNKPYKANMELGVGRLLRDDEDFEITWYGCDLEFYANRDIQAGEEIRANYDDFVERHGWKKMGL